MSATPAETLHLARLAELIVETRDAFDELPVMDSPETVDMTDAAWANLGRLVYKIGRRNDTIRQLGSLASERGIAVVGAVDLALIVLHEVASAMQAERDAVRAQAA